MKRRKLRAARINAGLSQERLAECLGTTHVSISYWETGKMEPSPHFKGVIKRYFKVAEDIDDFLAVSDDDDSEEEEQPEVTTPVWPPQQGVPLIATTLARRLQHIAHTDYATPDDMINAVRAAMKEFDMKNMGDTTYQITRREAMCDLAILPMMALGHQSALPSKRYEEMLRFCTAALEACWQLYRGSDPTGTQHAFECASTYVPILETIAKDSSRHRKEALDLATRYAIIKTMLGWHFLKRVESIGHAQNALGLSKESGNILLQMGARCKLSYTYITAKNYAMALSAMQEGEYALKRYRCGGKGPVLPPGMIANFYSGYSVAQVYNGIDPDVTLGIATDNPPLDRRIAFSEFTASDQAMEAAWIYCIKGDSERAMEWLKKLIDPETLASHSDTQSEYERHETLNILVGTLLQSEEKDMGHIVHAWTKTMEWVQLHQKEVLYDGAMINFALMWSLWRGEQAIKKLMSLTSHW